MSTPSPEPRPDHREGLWDPERKPVQRKRALPKSRVHTTLWLLIALVVVAAVLGVVF
ncbi:hypothetical protein [uncultured Corynebacterium sp.]|uniref:hypothetical protein n=1 Tax=uncultured Corynebacterium sp. TaxID=159447 RepID=UPI0025D11BB4|nr:hypothetical protein [uncultured Corynebacterium sp.]